MALCDDSSNQGFFDNSDYEKWPHAQNMNPYKPNIFYPKIKGPKYFCGIFRCKSIPIQSLTPHWKPGNSTI